MTTNTSQKIQAGIGAVMTAVGALGVVAPSRLSASTAAGEVPEETRYLTRLWTLREAALGVILLGTRKSAQRRGVLGVLVGLAAAEAVVGLTTPALTRQGRSSAVGSAAVIGAAGLFALIGDRPPSDAR